MATVQDYLKNDKWVKRLNEAFVLLDLNKNGNLSREDWLVIPDKLSKAAPDRPNEIAKLRQIMLEFTAAMGLNEGVKADKKKFLELFAAMAISERERVKRGEISLSEKVDNAVFDVVDQNHDGRITFEEFKIVMKIYGHDEDVGKATFALLDKNKNGAIDRKEYIEADMKFWYGLDDPETQGMLGDKFQ